MKRSSMAGKIVWKTLVMISEMDACQGIVDGCKFLLLFFLSHPAKRVKKKSDEMKMFEESCQVSGSDVLYQQCCNISFYGNRLHLFCRGTEESVRIWRTVPDAIHLSPIQIILFRRLDPGDVITDHLHTIGEDIGTALNLWPFKNLGQLTTRCVNLWT